MTHRIHAIRKKENEEERYSIIQGWVYTAIVFTIIAIISSIYYLVRGTVYEGHLLEWMNIVARVLHITFGIAWIGASFYFIFLENALNRKHGLRDEIAGNLWAVHGGGFYYLEKYKVAPANIPRHLHWFKYEAYFTWVSGLGLMFIIYYFNASAMLVDKNVMALSPSSAIIISLSSFVVGWLIYHFLCQSRLARTNWLFNIVAFIFLAGFAYLYTNMFSGRAAFIHFGALVGSIMVANVFFVIIPSQKAMVNAAKKGIVPDIRKGKNALFRSIHNNYLTLPVLFVMVSNHFPSTFSNGQPWIILTAITLGTAGIKHWLNLRERGEISVWIMPASIMVLLASAYFTRPENTNTVCNTEVNFSEVNAIIQSRCISCHSSQPTDKVYTAPPNGVVYDTPDDIVRRKDLILQRVVVTKTMPLNNKTNMTPEERELIRCWIQQGAKIPE
jgi:uncharacterized membrane protein